MNYLNFDKKKCFPVTLYPFPSLSLSRRDSHKTQSNHAVKNTLFFQIKCLKSTVDKIAFFWPDYSSLNLYSHAYLNYLDISFALTYTYTLTHTHTPHTNHTTNNHTALVNYI